MALPITVPYTFGNATTAIPLSNLDSDYATVYQAVNGIGNGSVALANVTITGGTVSNVSGVVPTPFTANGVVYASSTSALATGSGLQFDGTNLGVGVTPSTWTGALKALQVGTTATIAGGSGELDLYCNAYNNGSNVIYQTSSYASQMQMNNLGQFRWYTAPSGTAGTAISFTTSLSLGKGTTLVLENGTSSSGTGIAFPATQNASSDANTLDDYEEGSWTPVVTSGSGSLTSYTSVGTYTKIGNTVNVNALISLTNVGTASGQLNYSGLPFTPNYGTSQNQPATPVREAAGTGNIFYAIVVGNQTTGSIQNSTNGGITWTNTFVYSFTLTYRTS